MLCMQLYERLLLSLEAWQDQQPDRKEGVIQATLLMVLPTTCRLPPGQQQFHVEQGIGFARLCCQLVAYGSGLDNVWLLDDNILQCFQLDFEPGMLDGQLYHGNDTLKEISIGQAMKQLEAAVLNRRRLAGEPLQLNSGLQQIRHCSASTCLLMP